jgi:t-SNARE complex subunit (syntaxin)
MDVLQENNTDILGLKRELDALREIFYDVQQIVNSDTPVLNNLRDDTNRINTAVIIANDELDYTLEYVKKRRRYNTTAVIVGGVVTVVVAPVTGVLFGISYGIVTAVSTILSTCAISSLI